MKNFLSILLIFSITFSVFALDKQYEKDNPVELTSVSCDSFEPAATAFEFIVNKQYDTGQVYFNVNKQYDTGQVYFNVNKQYDTKRVCFKIHLHPIYFKNSLYFKSKLSTNVFLKKSGICLKNVFIPDSRGYYNKQSKFLRT